MPVTETIEGTDWQCQGQLHLMGAAAVRKIKLRENSKWRKWGLSTRMMMPVGNGITKYCNQEYCSILTVAAFKFF